MRTGVVLPFLDAAEVADAAVLAEQHGWDAIFLAEAIWGVDAWIALTAAAMRTSRIRLGTMLTPLARFKPWDVASKVGTLDRLSGGRVQLTVGLGAVHPGWTAFEPDTGRAERALLLDEGLAVYDGLMRGQPFAFSGKRYTVEPTDFFPPPPSVQQPRVPVWVVGAHPSPRSLGRAARWDGLVPNVIGPGGARGPESPAELAEIVAAARQARADAGLPWDGYDVVAEGITPADDPEAAAVTVRGWAEAGATWWIESDWSATGGSDALLRRISAGPPRS
jgi:alkanesulfonate monooxygenase SsuD/methylene tetrahydromethanopterin reductase-like flavin-dependent oxidoreductase (luciferase family)